MHKLLTLSILFFVASIAYGIETKEPFDYSKIREQIDENGIPTAKSVSKLETAAYTLYTQAKWKEAADVFHEYARAVNWLANLVSAGLDPFYNASQDQKQKVQISESLIEYERAANTYKRKRDEAVVMEGQCYENMGDIKTAVMLYTKSLESISLNDKELWDRTRLRLYKILEIE